MTDHYLFIFVILLINLVGSKDGRWSFMIILFCNGQNSKYINVMYLLDRKYFCPSTGPYCEGVICGKMSLIYGKILVICNN